MYNSQHFRRRLTAAVLIAVFAGTMVLSGCSENNNDGSSAASSGNSVAIDTKDAASAVNVETDDVDASYSDADSSHITFSGNSVNTDGQGLTSDGCKVTISKAGTYIVSGSADDGQIEIAAGKNDTVRLVMSGITLKSSSSSAIYASKCRKTILLLADGTVNTISDGGKTVSEDSDEPDAAIYAQNDLTILGSGELNVTGSGNNGITSKDTLIITGGKINVHAAHHGISGKDDLHISGGKIDVTTDGGDALRSNYSKGDDDTKGQVYIEKADITLNAANDGIQAETDLVISSGTVNIITNGGSDKNTKASSQPGSGMKINTSDDSSDETPSCKGLKAGKNINIADGTITIDSYDDSLHSNGDISVGGGTISVKSGDDGIHADGNLVVGGGLITIEKSYEGLEGDVISISGGTVDVTASDDGVNCAGGNDSSGFGGMDGNMQFRGRGGMDAASSTASFAMTGGTLYITAQGDGLDSNGSVEISGGTIVINGTTSGGNGILDHGGTMNVSGGRIIGSGTSDMLEMPDDTSSQYTMVILFDKSQQAGTLVSVKDSDGNILAAMTPEKSFGCFIFSSPKLKKGESYSVCTGGSATGQSTHGFHSKSVVSDGTEYTSFTLENIVTYANSSGMTTYTGGFGRGGMGGNNQIPGRGGESGQFTQMPGQDGESGQFPQMPGQDGESGQFPRMPGRGRNNPFSADRGEQSTQDSSSETAV